MNEVGFFGESRNWVGIAFFLFFILFGRKLWGALAGQIADGLLYYFSKTYRLFAEAQAYRKQMQYPSSNGGPPLTIEQAIYYLTRDYHETLTPEQARALLT